jgi:hypothetical protein
MIQIYDKFSRWNAKFTHIEKFIFIQQWLTQNMWSIGATMCIFYNKLQKISFKKKFIWKSEKKFVCKIIPLTPIYVLAQFIEIS